MYGNLVLALDGSKNSENVVPYAIPLARAAAATVTLLHVLPSGGRAPDAAAVSYLGSVAAIFRRKGLEVEQRILRGDPAVRLLDAAAELKADLLGLTTHGRGGLSRWTFGSVAQKVLRASPCPVLVVRGLEAPRPAIRRIILPLDGSAASDAAIAHARMAARAFRAQLQLVFVSDPPGIEARDSKFRRWIERTRKGMRDRFKTLASEIPELKTESILLDGDPATRILKLSQEKDPSMIVMGSHGRTGVRRWAFGSVAEKVLQAAEVPVLVARASTRSRSR